MLSKKCEDPPPSPPLALRRPWAPKQTEQHFDRTSSSPKVFCKPHAASLLVAIFVSVPLLYYGTPQSPFPARHLVNAARCWMCCVVLGLVVVAVVSLVMCFGTLAHTCTAGTQ